MEGRSEDRSRWLAFAEIALRKKRVNEILHSARNEQERIKQEIQPQVENYKRLKRSKRQKYG